jgi:hypothetical protein
MTIGHRVKEEMMTTDTSCTLLADGHGPVIERRASALSASTWRVLILAIVVGIAASTLTSAPRADAWTTSGSGSPGSVGVPVNYIYASAAGAHITMPERVVNESPTYAAYDQYVCATYRLFRLAGNYATGWNRIDSRQSCGWIRAAANRIQFPGAMFPVLPIFQHGVDVTYTWQLASGAVIGTRYVDSYHRGDYSCQSNRCSTGTTASGAYFTIDF